MEGGNSKPRQRSKDIKNEDDLSRRIVMALMISLGCFVWITLLVIWFVSLLFNI